MATVTRTTTFADGNTLTAAQLNNEFNNLLNAVAIVNSDISAGAAIATSKINATFPSGAIVGTTDSQTISGKVLSVNRTVGSYENWVTDSYSGSITFDLSTGNKHRVSLGGSPTLALSNVQNGQIFLIKLTNGGSNTVSWFAGISWAEGGGVPTLTSTAGKSDLFGFIQTGSNTYDGFIVGQNI